MSENSFGPTVDWTLPVDWRDVGDASEKALAFLRRFSEMPQGSPLTLSFLSDVVGAASLILQTPSNMRGPSFAGLNNEIKAMSAPRLKKFEALVGLALNPLDAVARLIFFAGQRLEHDDLDFVMLFARTLLEEAVLLQLDHCLVEYPHSSGDHLFEQQLGRTTYWYSFRESELWQIDRRLSLTPDLANDAMKRHRSQRDAEYQDPVFMCDLWIASPRCKDPMKELGKRDHYIKKMSRGRRFKDIERAWAEHVREIEHRHRYVYLYAERSGWERN